MNRSFVFMRAATKMEMAANPPETRKRKRKAAWTGAGVLAEGVEGHDPDPRHGPSAEVRVGIFGEMNASAEEIQSANAPAAVEPGEKKCRGFGASAPRLAYSTKR
jgi:hypothetical protein